MNNVYDGLEHESVYQKTIMQMCYKDYPDLDIWSIIDGKKQEACRLFKQLKEIESLRLNFAGLFDDITKKDFPFSVDTTNWDNLDRRDFAKYCNIRGYSVYAYTKELYNGGAMTSNMPRAEWVRLFEFMKFDALWGFQYLSPIVYVFKSSDPEEYCRNKCHEMAKTTRESNCILM